MQRGDDRVDIRPVRYFFVGFLLKGAAPLRAKIADSAFVQIAAWIGKIALQKGGFHALDVDVQAQVFAVYRHGGKVTARRGQASGSEDVVGHAGIEHGRVLLDIVQGQALHRIAEELAVSELVKADLERGFDLTQRSQEPFLADAHLREALAIHGHSRLEPREHIIRGAVEAVGTAEYIHKRPRLAAQAVPILGCHFNAHVEHSVERVVSVAGMGGLAKCWARGQKKRCNRDRRGHK